MTQQETTNGLKKLFAIIMSHFITYDLGPQSDEVEVKQEPTERPKKKKKKKKQKNAGASNNPGADEYEQF